MAINQKVADFAISAVHYNRTRISMFEVYRVINNSLEMVQTLSRNDVFQHLSHLKVFKTVYQENGQWFWGSEVQLVRVNGDFYLRTDGNSIAADNLGNLPEF